MVRMVKKRGVIEGNDAVILHHPQENIISIGE